MPHRSTLLCVPLSVVAATAVALAPTPPLPAAQGDDHAAPAQAGDAAPILLRFGWPESGSVAVTVALERASGAGRYACVLRWAPDPDAAEGERPDRIVRYGDFEFLELNGKRRGDPGFEAMNNVLAPALAAVPPFRVTADGEYVGLVDLDGAAEALAEAYEGLAPGAFATIAKLLEDPLTRGAIESSTAEDWSWWGSFWDGYETTPGEAVTSAISLPSGLTGRPIGGELTMECVDLHERDGAAAVHMRARSAYDPDDMLRVTMATLRRMSKEEVPDDAIRAVSRVDEVDGVYAVEGLRPLEVRWSKTITVDDGAGPKAQVESKRWTFDWGE